MHVPGRVKEKEAKKNPSISNSYLSPYFNIKPPAHEATDQSNQLQCSTNNTHKKIKINYFRILMCWELLERSRCRHTKKSFMHLAAGTVNLGYNISAGPVMTDIGYINTSGHLVTYTVHIAHACVHAQCFLLFL